MTKRDVKRKALRLANEAKRNKAVAEVKSQYAETRLRMVRTRDGVAIGVQAGHYGMDRSIIIPISDVQIVGAVENQDDLAGIVTKLGILALAKLIKYNLAGGIDDLARSLAKWADVDMRDIETAAEREYTAEDIKAANARLDAQKVTAALMATNDVEDLNSEVHSI